jgi:hypothetical protein
MDICTKNQGGGLNYNVALSRATRVEHSGEKLYVSDKMMSSLSRI